MVTESGVVAVLASVGAFGMGLVASAGAVRAREKSVPRRGAGLSSRGKVWLALVGARASRTGWSHLSRREAALRRSGLPARFPHDGKRPLSG